MPTDLFFFFSNDPRTTVLYTLSLHDALPISRRAMRLRARQSTPARDRARSQRLITWTTWRRAFAAPGKSSLDRKSTRLNSSHLVISYAVFCLKKKNLTTYPVHYTAYEQIYLI